MIYPLGGMYCYKVPGFALYAGSVWCSSLENFMMQSSNIKKPIQPKRMKHIRYSILGGTNLIQFMQVHTDLLYPIVK
jgi:hypothetical protein